MAAKKKSKAKSAPKAAPKAKAGNNQDMMVGAIVVIVVIAILGIMLFQNQIIGGGDEEADPCAPETYYESVTKTVTKERTVELDYEITEEWEGIPADNYSTYNPNDFYARQTRRIKNKSNVNGEFTVTCTFRTPEDGAQDVSQTNTIVAGQESLFVLNYKVTPNEDVTFPGCTVTAPTETETYEEDVTESVAKTRVPEGC